MEDSVGHGTQSSVPPEIKGWNWGAFSLNGIWGLGNKTYVALIAFIPVINIFMMFILGFKGNEMAWRNKEWKSVDHFMSVQKKWNTAGLVVLTIYIIVILKGIWEML